MDKIKRSAEIEYYRQALTCSECGEEMRDVFSIKTQGPINRLMIKDIEITDDEFFYDAEYRSLIKVLDEILSNDL